MCGERTAMSFGALAAVGMAETCDKKIARLIRHAKHRFPDSVFPLLHFPCTAFICVGNSSFT